MDSGITGNNGINFDGSLLNFYRREMRVMQAMIDN
jgi:hypothetical protein